MFIILNGSTGVGKTSVAWELMGKFDSSVMLDGDYICAVHPSSINDEKSFDYFCETTAALVLHHRKNGYENFILNYVFETPEQFTRLVKCLKLKHHEIRGFLLQCSGVAQEQRIKKRKTDQLEWELRRYKELAVVFSKSMKEGFIGHPLDTTNLSAGEVADTIYSLSLEE